MITLAQLPAGHPGRALLTGHTPWFAYQGDPRFSYGLYVPRGGAELERAELLVVVHGTDRFAQLDRDTWAAFGEARNLVILAPLFPAGVNGPDDLDNYKTIDSGGVRYDLTLFGMLEEIRLRWAVNTGRFYLAGHSGGGQFALRMLLLHAQRLRGVVISAPGRLTLVDPGSRWPRGTADVAERFGLSIDTAAIARTPILLSIGSEDLGAADLAAQRDPSQDGFGRTRRERLDTLATSLRALGADPAISIAPGGTHSAPAGTPAAQEFIGKLLAPSPVAT
jgi:pimeloyl-ACP methyl ester carboxylesterase